MNDITIIFFGASVAVCILALVTFFVVVSYHKALKRQRELEIELNKLKLEGSTEVNRILLEAQTKASEIIKNAQIKSQEFLNASEVFSGEFREKFQQSILAGSNQIISSISKDVSAAVQSEMKAFGQSLNKSIDTLVTKTNSDLEAYKKHAVEDLNAKIFKIVEQTTKKAIGKTLTKSEHEAIILKALEEAKKQNVL